MLFIALINWGSHNWQNIKVVKSSQSIYDSTMWSCRHGQITIDHLIGECALTVVSGDLDGVQLLSGFGVVNVEIELYISIGVMGWEICYVEGVVSLLG